MFLPGYIDRKLALVCLIMRDWVSLHSATEVPGGLLNKIITLHMPLPPPNDTQYVDHRSGLVFPWFTKPLLEVLITWDLRDKRVFEYGGGHSTTWWQHYTAEVCTVDADGMWILYLQEAAAKGKLIHRPVVPGEVELKSAYVNALYEFDGEFDIIVIDGSYRDECVAAALTKIKDGGIIICDNWDQDYVWDSVMASRLLDPWTSNIYVQPDHTNHEGRPWKTAFWQIYKGESKALGGEYFPKSILHVDNFYNSHRPMLWMALEHIKPGLVVEFGCGYGSTPLLHRYCEMQERGFISFETNNAYARNFTPSTALVADYLDIDMDRLNSYLEPVTIVFIDSAPGEQRAELLKRWANTPVLIVHDTEPESDYVYHIQDTLNSFKYRCDLIIEGYPQTTAVSNIYDFERWKGVTLGNYKFV